MYRYYKGEENNPFNRDKQTTQHGFWDYEKIFEEKFNEGNFNIDAWHFNISAEKEWKDVLSKKPIDKDELFKLWLFELLMVHLPDKYESEDKRFLNLYWDTTSMSI